MKDFIYAGLLIVAFIMGAMTLNWYHHKSLTCAQAVLHNNVAKCAVFIDKDVMR